MEPEDGLDEDRQESAEVVRAIDVTRFVREHGFEPAPDSRAERPAGQMSTGFRMPKIPGSMCASHCTMAILLAAARGALRVRAGRPHGHQPAGCFRE